MATFRWTGPPSSSRLKSVEDDGAAIHGNVAITRLENRENFLNSVHQESLRSPNFKYYYYVPIVIVCRWCFRKECLCISRSLTMKRLSASGIACCVCVCVLRLLTNRCVAVAVMVWSGEECNPSTEREVGSFWGYRRPWTSGPEGKAERVWGSWIRKWAWVKPEARLVVTCSGRVLFRKAPTVRGEAVLSTTHKVRRPLFYAALLKIIASTRSSLVKTVGGLLLTCRL